MWASTHRVQLRMITHGVSVSPEVLQREISTVERTYNQCEGMDFHLSVAENASAGASTLQDRLVDFPQGITTVNQGFFDFFTPWFPSRNERVIDVHWVDHLNANTRKEFQSGQPISIIDLGQAYSELSIANMVADPRPESQRVPSLMGLAGGSMLLAADTLKGVEGLRGVITDSSGVDHFYRAYHSSLLAHELGHILLEEQDGSGDYHDHYCTGIHARCPEENLMTAGGYEDRVYYDSGALGKVVGNSPLPALEKAQCGILLRRLPRYEAN
ncbi:MAG: hypothetical protein ACXVCH_03480 [Bdellovibrionota bacterium]